MNVNKLKGKIVESGMGIGQFCEAVSIEHSAFNRKTRGITEFTRDEMARISKVLKLTRDDIMDIFFTDMVA